MMEYLSVETTFFTIIGYPMSYIEFFGTLLNIACVWLVAKNKILTWPVGIVAVTLFFILFYEIRLYSDMVEQAYFFVTGFWGWWLWSRRKRSKDSDDEGKLKVVSGSRLELGLAAVTVLVGTIATGMFMARIHIILPAYFVQPADFPFLDAFTTILSFVATVLMARKRVECWYLWILVDIIGIWLYYVKGVRFIALEYVIFLGMASYGLYKWHSILNERLAYEKVQDRSGGREILPSASRS